ncbi:MAG: SpoIIE family protein phosphatase [Methylophaga sp.]|nr:SpoIIE family protein phosphatase [Methylophaga sp.]
MGINKPSPEQKILQLPNLKKYFIVITIILVIAILLGQLYQDFHRKKEHFDSQRIHIYQKQGLLASEMMDSMLLLHTGSNDVSEGEASRKLLKNTKQLMYLKELVAEKSEQRNLAADNKLLAKQEIKLVLYIDELLRVVNEVLASIKTGAIDRSIVSQLYKQFSPHYIQYQDESDRFIEKLSNFLEKESYEHRIILWSVVNIIMLLVIIVGLVFYRLISGLVNSQFELLEEDNELRKRNEQINAEHAELMTEQKMKMQSILDSTVDAIVTITAEGCIDSFNKAAETMFGYPEEFVIGKNVNILMPEPFSSEHDDYLRSYQQTGDKKIIGIGRETIAKRIDGSEFPINISVNEIESSELKLFTAIIQDITQRKKSDAQLQQTMADLRSKQEVLENEEKIAQHVFENITASNNDSLPEIDSWCEPMGAFSGDMMLSSLLPSGALRIVLCDFTGHGLPAALGAVPVSSIHSAMAQKGLPLEILMDELNNKLKELLPTGIFCCIAAIDLDATRTYARIWNAGLPDVLLVSKTGEINQKIKSKHLPLGVANYQQDEMHCEDVRLETGDAIYIYSDGITEAENQAGDMLGQAEFERILSVETDENGRLMKIRNTVNNFMDGTSLTDDLSLIEVKTLVTEEDIILES